MQKQVNRMDKRDFLISRGWVEAPKEGPWRWYRPEWKPVSYYTMKDAYSLQIAMFKEPREARNTKDGLC